MSGENRLTLSATFTGRGDLRYTPAGIPALDFMLRHASIQPEAGSHRRVECEIAGIAFGPQAVSLSQLPDGTSLRCEGFVARRWRTGTSIAMHVQSYEITKGN